MIHKVKKIGLLLLLALIFTISQAQETQTSQEKPMLLQIVDEIKENPETAKAKYMNTTVEITGFVVKTGVSRYLTSNVEISDRLGGEVLAICVLPYSGLNRGIHKLSDFSIGQQVTFSGRVHAVFVNDDRNSSVTNGILLKESIVVEK